MTQALCNTISILNLKCKNFTLHFTGKIYLGTLGLNTVELECY